MLVIRKLDKNLDRFGDAIAVLGTSRTRQALARAVNRVGTTAKGRAIRDVTYQSSIPRQLVKQQIVYRRATPGTLEGRIVAKGRPLSLKHFGALQLSYGVRAKVQRKLMRYLGAFMGPSPGVIAPKLGGHVFVRTTEKTWQNGRRLPIEMLFGPSVPEEMVKGRAAAQFERTVETMLPQRVEHELRRLLPK